METKTSVDPDGLLAFAGNFGKYQYILMSLFCVINVLSAFHYFGQTFIGILPVPKCDNNTIEDHIANIYELKSSNVTSNASSNCSYYDSDDMFGYTSITQQVNTQFFFNYMFSFHFCINHILFTWSLLINCINILIPIYLYKKKF